MFLFVGNESAATAISLTLIGSTFIINCCVFPRVVFASVYDAILSWLSGLLEDMEATKSYQCIFGCFVNCQYEQKPFRSDCSFIQTDFYQRAMLQNTRLKIKSLVAPAVAILVRISVAFQSFRSLQWHEAN